MTEANAEATLQPEARQRRWKAPDLLPAKLEKGDARIAVHSKKSILRMKTAFIDCAEANFLFVVAICIVLS